jgi:hypothetical protein
VANGVGDVLGGRGFTIAERFGDPEQEIRQHHAGVSACAQHGGAGHGARGLRKRRVAERLEGVGDGAQGEAQVGSGVAVRDRKDVDPVDLIATRGNPFRRREHRTSQARPVEVPDPNPAQGSGHSAIDD